MTAPTAAQWLGMLLVTEAARPREHAAWPAICWVVRNRVATPRRFRSTVEGCLLQPKQFSRFNDWEDQLADGGPDAVWDAACAWTRRQHLDPIRWDAEEVAAEVLAAPVESRPFGAKVLHYYSPVSMRPAFSAPSWWWDEIAREVPIPGVDPNDFRFGESK